MITISTGIEIGVIASEKQLKIMHIINRKWKRKLILHPLPKRPGLALAGYLKHIGQEPDPDFRQNRNGISEFTEGRGADPLPAELSETGIPGHHRLHGMKINKDWIAMAQRYGTPILVSGLHTLHPDFAAVVDPLSATSPKRSR